MPSFDLATFPPADTLRLVARHIDALCAAAPMGMNGLAMTPNSTPSPITTHAQALQQQQQIQRASNGSVSDINGNGGAHPAHCSPFHASAIPSIDLATYLGRVLKYCPCASECFIALVIYVERACNSGMVQLDRFSAHRLCITGVVVASKFFSDVFFTNSRYAKVGGLPTKELNQLELIFLKLCNFQLSIPIEELQTMGDRLLNYRRPSATSAPSSLVLPMNVAASEPPTPTSPYDISAFAWRHCPESPMTSTPGSVMGQSSPFVRTPTEYFAQHNGSLQARPRHFRTFSYHPQMNHQSFVTSNNGMSGGLHHPHHPPHHSFHGSTGGHQHSHSLSHASSFSHSPSQATAVAHLQHLQQPLSQANSPIRRTSGDSGYFALTPDRATTPASSTSSSTSSIYTGPLTKSRSSAPISHRHSYAHPGAQVYPNVYHQPFMAEHMAARLQQQQQKQQQQMCLQHISVPNNPTANVNATAATTNAGNVPISAPVPPASLQQALHRLNVANLGMTAPSMSSLYRTSSLSTLAPVSRKSLSTQSQHHHVTSPLSPSSTTTSPSSTTIPSVASPSNNGPPSFANTARSLVESPTGCCAPMAAENQSERPGALGERAGISSSMNTPSAHTNALDVNSSTSISPSSSVANQSDNHQRHSSSSNMSLHGHSPLGRMEITTSDNDDEKDNDNSKMNHDGNDNESNRPVSSSSSSMLQSPMQVSSSALAQSTTTASNNYNNGNVMIDTNQFNGWNLLVQNSTLSKDSTTCDMAGTIPHTTMVTSTLLSNPSANNHFAVNPAPPVMAASNMNGYYH